MKHIIKGNSFKAAEEAAEAAKKYYPKYLFKC
jgi:hypothetical protein